MSFTAIQLRIRCGSTRWLLSGLILGALLAGCASPPPGGVQVVDRDRRAPLHKRPTVTHGQYLVQRGDTLYSIAFRFGWDWKALAARNGIAPPYLIRVGQAIHFDGKPMARQAGSAAPGVTPATPARRPSAPIQRRAEPAPVVAPAPVKASPVITPVGAVARSASGWAWPSSGTLIGRFSSNGSLNKGIDIAGELGQPVLAASDGSVVYAGSGLRGYGELVIIKHSDTYVSAYGHNRRLLVREGQQVKVGQAIAEMGSTGADQVKLHFEIRRQGKPVDPLQYLPRR